MRGDEEAKIVIPWKILIVDDDPDTCQLLKMLFSRRGYQPVVVDSGQGALDYLEQRKPDLLILDILMPDMDGWVTYERARRLFDGPVIFLSAMTSGESAYRGLKMGAMDYIRKPFYPDELFTRTESLLENTRQMVVPVNLRQERMVVQRPLVTVVIPTLNEAANLPLVLPYVPSDWVDEVILVDGLSTDGTIEVAMKLLPSIKIVLENKPGKGAALNTGYKAAIGDILIVLDADGSNDPREIPRFVTALMEGADFVKGSRFAIGGGTTDMPRYRMFGNGVFVHLVNLLFRATFTDLCYGYHAFWRYCLDTIDLADASGFEIDTAIYLNVLRERLRIIEVPSFEGYRFFGIGKLKTIPDGLRIMHTIFREWYKGLRQPSNSIYIGFRGEPLENQPTLKESQSVEGQRPQ